MEAYPAPFVTDAAAWAEQQWGKVQLGDQRLNRRALRIGRQLAAQPAASLPQQMGDWASLKASYNLLHHPQVSHARLSEPHWQATRQQMLQHATVLLLQDVSELDYSHYAKRMAGLGPIGNGKGRGLLLHSTLAVEPQQRQVLGLAHQQPFLRQPHPAGHKRRQRPKAARESRVWGEAVRAIGSPRGATRWVVVADRGADATDFLLSCRAQQMDFTIRLAYEHRLVNQEPLPMYVLTTARSWTPVLGQRLDLPASGTRAARRAHLQISFGAVQLRAAGRQPPLAVWVVRAWEVDAPPAVEALEWLLVSSVPVQAAADAVERLQWYTARWLIEEYHHCLKTGCAIEQRALADAARLTCLLGWLALVAVRLLQLRQAARQAPERLATHLIEPLLVQLVAAHTQRPLATLTMRAFWRGVAQLGGFVGRRRDGDPGWKTLWRGWLHLQALAQGVQLAASWHDP